MFFTIAFVVIVLAILYQKRYWFQSDIYENFSDNPNVPVIKNGFNLAFTTAEELFHFPRTAARKFNNKSFRGTLFDIDSLNIMNAKDAERVLSASKHMEKAFNYSFLHPFLNTGLLTATGEKWFKRRRMLTPAFHFNILKEYFEIFKEESDSLVDKLKRSKETPVDVAPISTQFTLNTVCESALGVNLSKLGDSGLTYRNQIYRIGALLIFRMTRPWLFVDAIYNFLGYRAELDKDMKPAQEFTRSIIKQRTREFLTKQSDEKKEENEEENIYMSKKKRYAMMDTLLQAKAQNLIDDEGIIEETDTFTFAGHDTTSIAMTFTLFLLSHHPEAQKKMYEEIQQHIGDSDEFKLEIFNQMDYMDRVLKESLRIYPPVPGIGRTLTEDFDLDGIVFKKGTDANVFIYDIHRDPKYFPDPEKFDPDRFLHENTEKRHPFAFIAFSAGMRNCIGQRFALLELKTMLTKVIQNFTIEPITRREDLVFFVDLVLRTKNPVRMRFVPRK